MTDIARNDVVSVERVIPASPEAIFALIADPRRHHELDGSGTVKTVRNAPEKLELGSEFGMNMRVVLPYAMKSRVIEYDENRRLAWQTVPAYPLTDKLAGGRIWRYELEPVEGGTLVRESWDISQERALTRAMVRQAAAQTAKNMEATLARIEAVLTKQAQQA
ncbi:MAG: Polyketide cyclase/dehydrase [Frankiales bacterium]|nr:Polyketide cyclase/dehydrase [Frankiales bacterium]